MEQWKDIDGYEGIYRISTHARIYSVRNDIILKVGIARGGYRTVSLTLNGVSDKRFIHRLVATAFMPNPKRLPVINHKDEDPSNNCVENLEWCTYKYNSNYGSIKEKIAARITYKYGADNANSKKVYQFNLQGNFIKEYASAGDASRETGLERKSICKCGTGHLKTYGGYVWKYENSFELTPKKSPPRRGAVLMFDMNHKLLKTYESSRETAKDGFRPNDVCRCCRGERKYYAGHIWEYSK